MFLNADDMRARQLARRDSVDITSTAKDGSPRVLRGYIALPYDIPHGCAAGYLPEMNALIAAGDYSVQSDQPLMKSVRVQVAAAAAAPPSSGRCPSCRARRQPVDAPPGGSATRTRRSRSR